MPPSTAAKLFQSQLPGFAEPGLTAIAGAFTGVETAWPAARLALANQLWGEGFIFPGGETETLRLSRPLGVSVGGSLLVVGVGSGGPASALARNLGAVVTGVDTDPSLLASARGLISRSHLGKKVSIKAWRPDNPDLDTRAFHHCLALEPFRGARPEPGLYAFTQALRPGGDLVITELTAPAPLDTEDTTVRRWAELEHRDPAGLLSAVSVTRMAHRIGLDIRLVEDISQRHLDQAMLGWRLFVRGLDRKPDRQEAGLLMQEAELWLLRRRLIRDGRLQFSRWHAVLR